MPSAAGGYGTRNVPAASAADSAALRPRHAKLVANSASSRSLDFPVARDCGAATVGRIAVNGVISALAIEDTPLAHKMSDEVHPFHDAGTSTESVSQIALPGASLAALSR